MVKRFEEKKQYVQPLDLHGVKHGDVPVLVENFILQYQCECPLKIIVGNSDKMKKITVAVLQEHDFEYSDGDYYNRGYIVVLK